MKIPLFRSSSGLTHEWIQEDTGWRVSTTQNTEPFLDQNRAMANENDGYSPSRELRRVASIPFVVQQKWLNEEGWDCFNPDHADKLVQKLNSSEWAHLRTAPGQLAVVNGELH